MSRTTVDTPPHRRLAPAPWSDPSREALELIAAGVTQLAGFGIAALRVVRAAGKLEVMACAGRGEARAARTGEPSPRP